MNKEIQSIISRMETVNSGEPWFGRAVFEIMDEVEPANAFEKPTDAPHSLIELLYHMITWADFALKRLEKDTISDLKAAKELDWRKIDPKQHNWKKGLKEFKSIHKKITTLLQKNEDEFLNEIVDYRKYDFRFLLNGMIEHNIYHLGQIAYLNKMLS